LILEKAIKPLNPFSSYQPNFFIPLLTKISNKILGEYADFSKNLVKDRIIYIY